MSLMRLMTLICKIGDKKEKFCIELFQQNSSQLFSAKRKHSSKSIFEMESKLSEKTPNFGQHDPQPIKFKYLSLNLLTFVS